MSEGNRQERRALAAQARHGTAIRCLRCRKAIRADVVSCRQCFDEWEASAEARELATAVADARKELRNSLLRFLGIHEDDDATGRTRGLSSDV
jgi:hypothetical protein